MNELEVKRTPELIGIEIRDLTVRAKKMTIWFGIEIGRRLVEAKELVGHGEWMKYLEEQTEFSQSQANRLMRIFNEYASKQTSIFGAETNSSTLNNLSISNALRLLAVPEEERENFAEEHDVEHLSARELEKLIKEKEAAEARAQAAERQLAESDEGTALKISELEAQIDAAKDAADKAASDKAKAENELKQALSELKELQERPIEVAVEVDEQAVERAKTETAAEYADKISKANEETEAAKAKVQKLKDKLAKAESDAEAKVEAAEKEKARAEAELENLKKQVKLANPETAIFKTMFETVQDDFRKLNKSLNKIRENDAETAGKLTVAVRDLLERLGATLENGGKI